VSGRRIVYRKVLSFDPSTVPEGDYFDSGTPDRDRENRYFPSWYNDMTPWGYRNQKSHLQVAYDSVIEANVLEWQLMHVRYLLTTDPFWSEVRLSGNFRMTTADCVKYHDIPNCTESRIGIVFRYEDHRHFYFLAMEGLRRIVLYRRDDEEWQVLAEKPKEIDPDQYYQLGVEAVGNHFRCWCEDTVLTATDKHYIRGRVGLRGNSLGKIASAVVEMTPGQQQYHKILRDIYQKEVQEIRANYPKLKLVASIDLNDFGAVSISFANLRGTSHLDMLLTSSANGAEKNIAMDIEGRVLWERNQPLYEGKVAIYRDAPEGHRELIKIKDDHFEIIDLSTGETVNTPLFPRPIRHKLWVMPTGMANHPGNVRGTDIAGDLLIRYCDAETFDEDQARLMVIDDQFNEIWSVDSQPPGLGHTFSSQFFDVDGDGKDEVLASYQLLSSKGQTIWRMQDTINDIQNRAGAGHIDFAVIGNLAGDEELDPTIFVCSGGVYVVDGMTGNLRAAHHIGHTQGGKIGNFFSDLPGLELAGRNRWGSMGIVNFVNGRGNWLNRMHPDPIGHPSGPVNWTGDGQELVFIGSYRGFGLYDGHGRKVVELPYEWCNESNYRNRPTIAFANVLGDARQEVIHFWQGVLTIYTQDTPPPDSSCIYNPIHQGIASWPGWTNGNN